MFSLTSAAFTVVIRVALVIAFLWVVVRWGAAAKTGVWAIIRRIVSLLVIMLLGVLNVLVPINAEYGWYTSWSDVWSDLTGGRKFVNASATKGLSADAAVRDKVGPSPLARLPRNERDRTPLHLTPTSYGGYQTFTVPGAASHVTGQVTMWFPPDYQTNPREAFPVIEVYHGYLPAPLATFKVFHMDQAVRRLHEGGTMRPPIFVIPHWAPGRLDTECVNGGRPGDPAMETWMTTDLPAWVYTHFRVDSSRESWATQGASAGGWCALMSTMLHPATYSAAISLGGYAEPDFDPSYRPFDKNSAAWRRYDLVHLARTRPPAVALWALTSKPDKLSAPTTKELIAGARAPLSITPTVLPTGSHRAQVWSPYIEPSLDWLARTVPGFGEAQAGTTAAAH